MESTHTHTPGYQKVRILFFKGGVGEPHVFLVTKNVKGVNIIK